MFMTEEKVSERFSLEQRLCLMVEKSKMLYLLCLEMMSLVLSGVDGLQQSLPNKEANGWW
jgi:hypothetical protein